MRGPARGCRPRAAKKGNGSPKERGRREQILRRDRGQRKRFASKSPSGPGLYVKAKERNSREKDQLGRGRRVEGTRKRSLQPKNLIEREIPRPRCAWRGTLGRREPKRGAIL